MSQHQSAQHDATQQTEVRRCHCFKEVHPTLRPISLLGSRIVKNIRHSLRKNNRIHRNIFRIQLLRYAAMTVGILFFCSTNIYAESTEPNSVIASDSRAVQETNSAIAEPLLPSAQISLSSAYGVYRNNRFLGAVKDTSVIEHALSAMLTAYSNTLPSKANDVFYTDDISYIYGMYLTESLTDAQRIADLLTKRTTTTQTVNTIEEISVAAMAAQYSMTPDALCSLNPILQDPIPVNTAVTVSFMEYALPIAYTATITDTAQIPYGSIEVADETLPRGEHRLLSAGQPGEIEHTMQVTYVNGVEVTRTLLHSVLQAEPIAEQVSVGTQTAAPASTDTKLYGTGKYSWPVNGGYISDPYISNRNHGGLDIAAPANTQIYASADGVVTTARWNANGYGYYIIIDHGDNYETLYAHCNQLLVSEGETVTEGQLIALVGSTGRSTGNHLHFEVRYQGVQQNPVDYIRVNAD